MSTNIDPDLRRFLEKRSPQHFSVLYRKYAGSLLRVAMYLNQNHLNQAEDLVQETWITALEKLEKFKGQSTLKTWLTGVLINKFRESKRKDRGHSDLELAYSAKAHDSKQDLSMDIKNAIIQLSKGYREILTLHDIEGFKHKEIADILGINEGTSKSQLFQARKAMRNLLTEYNN